METKGEMPARERKKRLWKMEKVRRAVRRIKESRGRSGPVAARRRSFWKRLKARLGVGGGEEG